jgi:integrase
MAVTRRRHFGSARKLPSGRYQARYWHAGTRHIAPETFSTKTVALAWLSRAEADITRGAWLDPAGGKVTFAELAARWLESNPMKRGSSKLRDESILDNHIVPVLGPAAVSRITRVDVQQLVDGWSQDHAPSTVVRMFAVVRGVFGFAVASDMIGRSPCTGVRVPRGSLVERPVLSTQQLQGLACELGPDQAAMMWLGVVGGLRWAECAGLTVSSLDLLKRTVSVSQQLGRDGRLAAPKSRAGTRRLSLPDWLLADLASLLSRRGLTAANPDELVFLSREGKPLSYTNWRRRIWEPACRAANLTGLRFHDLRSMAATALVAAGVDIKTAQTRLGHSSPSVTLGIYARATEHADRLAADAVGAFFAPAPDGVIRGNNN